MSAREELLTLAREADRRGDRETAMAALRKLDSLDYAPTQPAAVESATRPPLERGLLDQALIGLGRGFTNFGEGALQLAGAITGDLSPEVAQQQATERALYQGTPVAQSSMGQAGELVGESLPWVIGPGGAAAGGLRGLALNAGAGAGLGGLAGAAQWVDPNDPNASRLANVAMGAGMGGAVGGLAPPVLGWLGSKIGRLGGDLLAGREEAMALGKEFNVPVYRTDLPGVSRTSVAAENMISDLPFGMAAPRRKQAAALGQAAQGLYEELGGVPTLAAEDVMRSSAAARLAERKATSKALYDKVDVLSAEVGPMTATGTRQVVQDALEQIKRGALPDPAAVRQLEALDSWLEAPRNFSDLRALHSDLGDLVRDYHKGGANAAIGAKGVGMVQRVKDALESELDTLAEKSSVPQLTDAWRLARKHYREELVPSKQPDVARLTSENADADAVLQSFLQRGAKTDKLGRMFDALGPEGRDAIRNKLIGEAIDAAQDPATGAFQAGKFARFLEDREGIRSVFFKEDPEKLNGLIKLARYVQRSGSVEANPPTGARTVPLLAVIAGGGKALAAVPVIRGILTHPRAQPMLRALGGELTGEKATFILNSLARMAAAQSENPEAM